MSRFVWKKFILVILIALTLLSSCNPNIDDIKTSELPKPSLGEIDIDIEDIASADDSPELNIYSFCDPFVMQPEPYIEMWEENLRDYFGININFQYIEWNSSNMTKSMANLESVSGLDGFLFFPDSKLFGYIMGHKDNYLSPISEYCNESDLPAHLSESDKEIYTIDSQLWALSGYNIYHTLGRQYNMKFLEGFPVDNLRTIEGIIEYIKFLGENHEDAYFTDYTYNYFFESFIDIFMAYGLYPSMDYQIGYNPQIGEFQDVVLQSEFKEVFELIMYMNDEKMIDSGRNNFSEEEVGVVREAASYHGAGWDREDYHLAYKIDGLNTSQSVITKPKLLPWGLLINTKDKEIKLNEFIEKIWNNPEARRAFNYGIDGFNYIIDENGNMKAQTPEGTNVYSSPMVVGAIIEDTKYGSRFPTENNQELISESSRYYLIKTIELYGGINSKYKSIFSEFLDNTLVNHIPFDRALEIYKSDIEKFGLSDVVKELNIQLN